MQFHNSQFFPPKGRLNKPLARRFQNLLEMVYLEARPDGFGEYLISDSLVEKIERELNSHPPEKTKTRRGNPTKKHKKRIRKRKSYAFWAEKVKGANIADPQKAYQFLYGFFVKLDMARSFGSMTMAKYELESLRLSVEDHYKAKNLNHEFIARDFYDRGPRSIENEAELEIDCGEGSTFPSCLNDDVPF